MGTAEVGTGAWCADGPTPAQWTPPRTGSPRPGPRTRRPAPRTPQPGRDTPGLVPGFCRGPVRRCCCTARPTTEVPRADHRAPLPLLPRRPHLRAAAVRGRTRDRLHRVVLRRLWRRRADRGGRRRCRASHRCGGLTSDPRVPARVSPPPALDLASLPASFARAVASARVASVRPEVRLQEVAGPQRLAPYSFAMTADLAGDGGTAADPGPPATGPQVAPRPPARWPPRERTRPEATPGPAQVVATPGRARGDRTSGRRSGGWHDIGDGHPDQHAGATVGAAPLGAVGPVSVRARRLLEDAVVVAAGAVALDGQHGAPQLLVGRYTSTVSPAPDRIPELDPACRGRAAGMRGAGRRCALPAAGCRYAGASTAPAWDHRRTMPSPLPLSPSRAPSSVTDSAFLRACRGEQVPHTPVWFMRQAGRSLPEYRAVRAHVPMLASCRTPELVVEITLQPLRRYGVDAAVLFSDIVVPLQAVGVGLDIVAGVGPVIEEPVRRAADLARLRPLTPDDVPDVSASVTALVDELGGTPLIGFAGAPFTLASYLVEGGPSRNHERTKALMYGEPGTWHALLDRLADIALGFLKVQVAAGAAAVQLFDSWAGVLSATDYRRYVLPHSAKVLGGLAGGGVVPRIHFGVGTGELLGLLAEAGADVVGVDWRVPLDAAAGRVGPGRALQGHLDPAVLFAPWGAVAAKAREVLAAGKAADGHIFNLGHGVLPDTDPRVLERLVELVHAESAR